MKADLDKSGLYVGCFVGALAGAVFHDAWGWSGVAVVLVMYALQAAFFARRYIRAGVR